MDCFCLSPKALGSLSSQPWHETHAFLYIESMVSIYQIRRYAWVVDFLMRRKSATIQQINEAWLRSPLAENDKEAPSRKLWYRCFEHIAIIYGILIDADKRGERSRWRITNPEAIHQHDIEKWMLACVSYRNLIEECLDLHHRIDIESFPSENNRLRPIVRAMRESVLLEIGYRKYGCDDIKFFRVAPYFIKTYKHRFYVLCQSGTGLFCMFSLDRIVNISTTTEKFVFPQDFTVHDFFAHSYGVMLPPKGMEVEEIIVRARGDEQCYLRDVPLHKTQVELEAHEDYTDFMVSIYPTNDFIGDILQQQTRLEIIKPEWLRSKVKSCIEKMRLLYA